MIIKYFKIPSLSLILTLLLLFNFLAIHSFTFGLILGLFYLIFNGYLLAQSFFPQNSVIFKLFFGFLFNLCLISLICTIIYYIYKIDDTVVSCLIIFLPILIYGYYLAKSYFNAPPSRALEKRVDKNLLKTKIKIFCLMFLYFFFYILCFKFLFWASTDKAILSPFEVISPYFFVSFFISTLILAAIILKNKHYFSSIFLSILHAFLFFSAALAVYKLGYGYDPFIHEATEKIISDQGFINPKNFYYIGQYSLVVFLAKIFCADVFIIDKLLVILLSALYLPTTIYYSLTRSFDFNRNFSLLSALGILAIPFSDFIITTPQALANLLSIIIIFLSLIYITKRAVPLILLILMDLTVLAVHPLAGIPISIFLVLLILFEKIKLFGKKDWMRKIAICEFIFTACLIIPAVFLLNSYLGSGNFDLEINLDMLKNPWQILTLFSFKGIYFLNRYNIIKDIVYFYGFNIGLIIFVSAAAGMFFLKKEFELKKFLVYPITFFILIINFILLKGFLVFKSLIEYERADFANRIFQLSFYFILPFAVYLLYIAVKKCVESKSFFIKLGLIIFLSIFITCSFYLTYPRNDNYVSNHGYNVSAADIEAVHYIEDQSSGKDYFVLANQTTSVTALKEFGFKKYFGNNFYYPIPTSTPLYQYYTEMVTNDGPTEENAKKAMDFMQVDLMYFVVNTYWYRSDRIIDLAKHTANEWIGLDNDKIFIFKYTNR